MIDLGKRSLLGIGIDAIDYEAAVDRILDAAEHRQPLSVSALAVHGLMTGVLNDIHRYRLNQFDLLLPDGQPVRWALNWLHGCGLRERVYGPRLMGLICERVAATGLPVFLFGGTECMLDRLRQRLLDRTPKLRIVGTRPSRYRTLSIAERDQLADSIGASGAAITFVGIGCPRQEVFAYEMRDKIKMPVVAVGAAFSFLSGTTSQAPATMQRWGLEWLFRLACEPRRLWKRYLLLNPLYVSLVLLQATRLYQTNSDTDKRPERDLCYG